MKSPRAVYIHELQAIHDIQNGTCRRPIPGRAASGCGSALGKYTVHPTRGGGHVCTPAWLTVHRRRRDYLSARPRVKWLFTFPASGSFLGIAAFRPAG